MSNYGVFEASSTDGHEEEQRQRQATRDLGRAIEAAREGFGDFLGAATDRDDYKDRLALVMNDLMQKVADSGVMPVPGVMRKVKAALRPEFRTASRKKSSLEDDVLGIVDDALYQMRVDNSGVAPHPDYGTGGWTSKQVHLDIMDIWSKLSTEEIVSRIRDVLDRHGYDSIDRELAFWHFSQVTGNDYNDYYDAWMRLHGYSASKLAIAEAESIASSKGITASRKQTASWDQEYDGTWFGSFPNDVVGWLTPSRDSEFPDTYTVSAEIDNEENGRELFTEFNVSEAEGKRMVEEAAAKVIASRRKAGLSDWFIDGTDFAQMSYDGMPDGNFAFLNVYLHGDGYYMWSVDVENGQANHGKLNATDLESAIAEAEPLISAELGLDPFMYSTRKQALELGEWEEDLPGLGYGKATKVPGGGYEVYIWDEAGQNETLTPVNTSEQARSLFYEVIKGYPGSGFDTGGDDLFLGRRKQALELGEWEEDLPGLGYAKATKTPGGGWEVYIWDEAGQNETLTPVNSPEEARRLFQDTIKSYPGSGFDHIDF